MTNREQLYENYEDALFAILMDDLAAAEGERLLELNQQLQDDPDAAIPDEVRQRCIAVINREFAKKRRAASVQRAKKVLKILPWAVVIAMALMAVAMAAFPSFRAGVLNVLRIDAADNTTWSFRKTDSAIKSKLSYSIDLPDGFIITDSNIGKLMESVDYQDNNHPNSVLSVSIYFDESTVLSIDNDHYTYYSTIDINGLTADLYSNDSNTYITWADSNYPFVCSIQSTNIDRSVVTEIARSFKLLK